MIQKYCGATLREKDLGKVYIHHLNGGLIWTNLFVEIAKK